MSGSRRFRDERDAAPSVYLPVGHSGAGTTKETPYKTASVSGIPTRQSSSTQGAALGRSEPEGLGAALLPARRPLYSVDALGRRSEIPTGHLSAAAYQALLEACRSPLQVHGKSIDPVATGVAGMPTTCVRSGPETHLPLPDAWELLEATATPEERFDRIRTNLARTTKAMREIPVSR